MITTGDYNYSLKLFNSGIRIESDFYYNRKTKNRVYGNDTPKGIRDFDKLFIPAPADSEIDSLLPAQIKTNKGVFELTIKKEKKGFKIFYEHKVYDNYGELYPIYASAGVDAKILMAVKLKKEGAI